MNDFINYDPDYGEGEGVKMQTEKQCPRCSATTEDDFNAVQLIQEVAPNIGKYICLCGHEWLANISEAQPEECHDIIADQTFDLSVKVSQWLTWNIGQAVQSPSKRVIHTEKMLRNLQRAWFPEGSLAETSESPTVTLMNIYQRIDYKPSLSLLSQLILWETSKMNDPKIENPTREDIEAAAEAAGCRTIKGISFPKHKEVLEIVYDVDGERRHLFTYNLEAEKIEIVDAQAIPEDVSVMTAFFAELKERIKVKENAEEVD